jgi:hypothetical protein
LFSPCILAPCMQDNIAPGPSRPQRHSIPQSTPRKACGRGGTCPDRPSRKHYNRSTSSCHCTSSICCRPYHIAPLRKDENRLSQSAANNSGRHGCRKKTLRIKNYDAGWRQAQPQLANQMLARVDVRLNPSGVAAGSTQLVKQMLIILYIRLLHDANASAL